MTSEPISKNLFSLIATGKLSMPPSAALLGLKVDHAASGKVSLSMRAAASFLNPAGHVQGGMLAAMLDEAMGIATLTTLDQGEYAVTLEMNVQFIGAATEGELQAQGRLIHRTGKIVFVDADLFQNEKLIARATSTSVIKGAHK